MATLGASEGAGMGTFDTSTIGGPKATLVWALERGDAAPAASLCTSDARPLPPGAPPITGPDGLLESGANWLDTGTYPVVRRQADGSW